MAMMPNAAEAVLPIEKVTGYLLSRAHPVGSRKAAFFRLFGFDDAAPDALREALLAHAVTQEVSRKLDGAYGTKYEISGPLLTPSGRLPAVKTVWIIVGDAPPRFVTAVPAKGNAP